MRISIDPSAPLQLDQGIRETSSSSDWELVPANEVAQQRVSNRQQQRQRQQLPPRKPNGANGFSTFSMRATAEKEEQEEGEKEGE